MIQDDFMAVIQTTADIAEVDVSAILSNCKQSEAVEARCIAVTILHDMGYSIQRIARYFHKTEAGIRCILSLYDDRVETNPFIARLVEVIRKKLPSK